MDLNRSQRHMLLKFSAYGFLKNLRFFEPFLLLFFTAGTGLSYLQFGTLVGVREIAIYVLEIPTGIIADVTGRRRTMMLSFSSYLMSFAVFSAARSFWGFVPGMVLFGAGEAFRSGTHKSMIMQHLDIEGMADLRVRYYGTTRSASRLGSAVSALVGAAVVFLVGSYHIVFIASMLPYVLGLLLMTTYPKELDGKVTGQASLRGMARHTVDSFRAIWRTRETLKILLNAATTNSFFKVAKDYLQPILVRIAVVLAVSTPLLAFADTEEGQTAVVVGVVYFIIHMFEAASSRHSGRFADRIGHLGRAVNVLFWAFAALFCLAGAFLWLSGATASAALQHVGLGGAVLMLLLFHVLNNLRMPMVTGFISDRTEAQQRATVLSVLSQLRAVGAAIIAPLLGLAADHLGIAYVFLIGGPVLLVAAFVLRLRGDQDEATDSGD